MTNNDAASLPAPALDARALAALFRDARTHAHWLDAPVDDATLRELFALAVMAPTSANSEPGRLVFVRTPAGKERLRPALAPPNVEKTMGAPVTVIVAADERFVDHMPRLLPGRPETAAYLAQLSAPQRSSFAETNGTLFAAYVILAARALGLDAGPMGGFDKAKVDAAFFAEQSWKSVLLINLGHGDASKLHPRSPRMSFDDAVRLA